MTNPVCRDCGKECVWGKTKDGKPILYDLGPPHFVRCPAKNGATAQRQPSKSPLGGATDEAVTALRSLGYLKREAVAMLARVPAAVIAAGDVAQIVTEALKGKGGE
jgi:hypothetical protein